MNISTRYRMSVPVLLPTPIRVKQACQGDFLRMGCLSGLEAFSGLCGYQHDRKTSISDTDRL